VPLINASPSLAISFMGFIPFSEERRSNQPVFHYQAFSLAISTAPGEASEIGRRSLPPDPLMYIGINPFVQKDNSASTP